LVVLGIVISEVFKFNTLGAIIIIISTICAPIAHIVGIVMGAKALTRQNDNKKWGAIGIALNGMLIAFGLYIGGDLFHYMGVFN
jgi:hypothetical protein